MNNSQILKDTVTTTDIAAGGLLAPEQADKFVRQIMENTVLWGKVRHLMRKSRKGEIDKVGIASRILRGKTENQDDGYRAKPTFSKILYDTATVRLPWEVTEDTLRENIEGQSFEAMVTDLMTKQLGVDLEDLCLNGDTSTVSSDEDYEFLTLKDGWLKRIAENGHVQDRSGIDSGAMSLNVYYDALADMKDKYNSGSLVWFMSPSRRAEWDLYLYNRFLEGAGGAAERLFSNPAAIPVVEIPRMPKSKILLVNPQNLGVVNTYTVILRKTTEGQTAIYEDKRFYQAHVDVDCIVEEYDATVLITGLA